jgi:hypothetical protein
LAVAAAGAPAKPVLYLPLSARHGGAGRQHGRNPLLRIEIIRRETAPDICLAPSRVDPITPHAAAAALGANRKWTRTLVFVATNLAAEIAADKLRKASIEASRFRI